ncbi:unnamed protein product, partial [Protopolystoma xenopodis]
MDCQAVESCQEQLTLDGVKPRLSVHHPDRPVTGLYGWVGRGGRSRANGYAASIEACAGPEARAVVERRTANGKNDGLFRRAVFAFTAVVV